MKKKSKKNWSVFWSVHKEQKPKKQKMLLEKLKIGIQNIFPGFQESRVNLQLPNHFLQNLGLNCDIFVQIPKLWPELSQGVLFPQKNQSLNKQNSVNSCPFDLKFGYGQERDPKMKKSNKKNWSVLWSANNGSEGKKSKLVLGKLKIGIQNF